MKDDAGMWTFRSGPPRDRKPNEQQQDIGMRPLEVVLTITLIVALSVLSALGALGCVALVERIGDCL